MIAHAAAAAAEGAEHAVVHPPFWEDSTFWVLVAFIIFFGIVGRTAYKVVTVALDDRSENIKTQIESAQRLQAEAQELLASYERKQREAAQEAETIIEHARREADKITEEAERDLEVSLKRREQLAMERIAQAEAVAVAEVRAEAVNVALAATEQLLGRQMKGKQSDTLIAAAIEDLPARLKAH